jgi:protein-tyrosine phosphatase
MNDWPTFSNYDAHFVTPYLAVGACPRPEHVPEIEAAGIRGILNVVSGAGPEAFTYVARLPPEIHWRHCGFWDGYFGPPERGANQILCASFARMVTIEGALMLRDHSPMLLHCGGGSGRSGNVAAILVAACEGITIDEASARMQQHRKVIARFFREGFWKNTPDEELLRLAKAVLSERETPRSLYCARIRGDVEPAEPTFERIVE